MKKLLLAAAVLMATTFANAKLIEQPILDYSKIQNSTMTEATLGGLGWTVGDFADYSINAGIIKGTMHSFVREEITEGYWVQQDMDMGMFGKQKVEILFEGDTGQVLALLVNGEKQTIPDQGDMEVIDVQNTTITVKAGSFDCLYVKILNKKDNKESEAWINQDEIPIGGLIQQKAPSQMGEVVVELTKYKKS